MYERNIPRARMGTQAVTAIKVVQSHEQDVFCPMCEAWHANNTWCQYSGNEATEGF